MAKMKGKTYFREVSRRSLYFFTSCTKPVNRGWGKSGRAVNSGWNCVPRKKGCSDTGNSAISISTPSGDWPENTSPCASSCAMYSGLTSYRCRCRSCISALP
ncbi:MAG: hypothetical protein UU98_C0013G0019 [Parcubacteria group bacterium GW2011_GWD2_42_14]|nr:MAG: hypothetical protein UU98_C0013G0019 [Parcubacteria group bacterium GW2011_GWD2_42_14]